MNGFRKQNDLDGSPGDLRALGHPQRPWQAQPWGVQQVPFIFIKMNIWNMFHERFSKRKRSGWVPRWSEVSRTPSATSTSSTMGVQQVPFIFIKMNIWNMFHERFSKTKWPGWVPRWSEGSRTPSATSTSSTCGVQQVPIIFLKMNIWNMFHERFSQRKRSGWVPRWSKGSRTPSATLTSSTMGSTASTIYIHKNEHLKHVSWTIFAKKTIWMGPKVIWGL